MPAVRISTRCCLRNFGCRQKLPHFVTAVLKELTACQFPPQTLNSDTVRTAPIMATEAFLKGLNERLTALQDTVAQVRSLIDRLADQKFEHGAIPSADDRTEQCAEIRQILREVEDDTEVLQEEVDDLPSGRPGSEKARRKAKLKEGVEQHQKDVAR
jgi:hypothetical protein